MKTNNQKNQIIVLCCLAAVVLGLGVFKVMGGKKPNPAHKPAVVGTQVAQAKPVEPSVLPQSTEPAAATQIPGQPVTAARDPFVPQVILETGTNRNTSHSRPTSLASGMPRLPLPMVSPLPTQPISFVPDNRQTTMEPDPLSTLRLTGVIEGSCNVAIIRGEAGSRYIVREGQSIDGKYVVQSISRSGVRLRYGGKTYVLTLGSPPSKKSA